MTIPNVSMRWCQKQAKCQWCEAMIEPGQAMVVMFYWNKGSNNRRWNVQKCYHPECWLKQGYDYLERNPYVPVQINNGRPRLELSEQDKRQRYLILRRYHSLVQRLNRCNNGSDLIKSLELECQMADLILEIAKVGGVPKKWLTRL